MTELINPVPIEIVDLGIETYAQIEIEKILLISFRKTQVKELWLNGSKLYHVRKSMEEITL